MATEKDFKIIKIIVELTYQAIDISAITEEEKRRCRFVCETMSDEIIRRLKRGY